MQMQAAESYEEFHGQFGYAIQVFVRSLEDGTFETYGWIRHAIKNPTVQEDLPYEYAFGGRGEKHQTADAALATGIAFARKKIDDLK